MGSSGRKKKVVIIFEGRDAPERRSYSGRITEHLNPRISKVGTAQTDEIEIGQWYFQRYVNHFPKGEIVFFDRSWYNHAIIRACKWFLYPRTITKFYESGKWILKNDASIPHLFVKMYFSISKRARKRLKEIINDPLKKWKYSACDSKALELWDALYLYKEKMFERTAKSVKWKIIKPIENRWITALEYIFKNSLCG